MLVEVLNKFNVKCKHCQQEFKSYDYSKHYNKGWLYCINDHRYMLTVDDGTLTLSYEQQKDNFFVFQHFSPAIFTKFCMYSGRCPECHKDTSTFRNNDTNILTTSYCCICGYCERIYSIDNIAYNVVSLKKDSKRQYIADSCSTYL